MSNAEQRSEGLQGSTQFVVWCSLGLLLRVPRDVTRFPIGSSYLPTGCLGPDNFKLEVRIPTSKLLSAALTQFDHRRLTCMLDQLIKQTQELVECIDYSKSFILVTW